LNFEVGEFLYTSTDQKVKFPLFEPKGKPYEWKATEPEKPKKKGKNPLRKLYEFVFPLLAHKWRPREPQPDQTDEDEQLEEEDEETLGLLGEPDEDW
jgi:hypothetical protein